MFLQEVPNQGTSFTPMTGEYSVLGNDVTFQAIPAQDPSSGQITGADFGSVYLSPSSNKITFDLWGGLGNTLVDQWDIYVENADGSTTQITNDSYEDSYPQLSSDGRKVVFTSLRQGANGPNSIVIRDAVNPLAPEQVFPMPPGATNVWDPTFSPDGSMIAVEASDYDGVNTTFHGIVLMDADGGNPQLITNPYSATCDCWDGYPAFTADSSQIVFAGATNGSSGNYVDIYITNLDGSNTTQVSDGVGYNVDPIVVQVPGLAQKIVFESDRDKLNATGSTGYEIYSMNLDGTGLVRLTSNSVFDGFSQAWFQAPATAAHTRGTIRPRHGHALESQSPAQRLVQGFKW